MSDDDDIPDDKLLAMPDAGNPSSRSILRHERELSELAGEKSGNGFPGMLFPWSDPLEIERAGEKYRRDQMAYEQEMRDISERQDRLLLRIGEEETRIDERRREIDDHAIRLQDGRRAYVDGDRYRDGEGSLLAGADEAEAARQHEYRPDASTWQEKQEIERRAEENQRLREKILKDRESGQGPPQEAAKRMDGYEKEFAEKVQARAGQPVVDYGSADYMSEYQLSSAPAFNNAAGNAMPVSTSRPKEDEGDANSAEAKKAPPPPGRGGLKL
jgi:hypothetical protein